MRRWRFTTPTPRWRVRWSATCSAPRKESKRGRAALRGFVEQVFVHQPPQRRRFRTGFLTDGARVTWEYPPESPDGDQMDIVEVMEIRDGLIADHRVYWGWLGVNMLKSGEHPS